MAGDRFVVGIAEVHTQHLDGASPACLCSAHFLQRAVSVWRQREEATGERRTGRGHAQGRGGQGRAQVETRLQGRARQRPDALPPWVRVARAPPRDHLARRVRPCTKLYLLPSSSGTHCRLATVARVLA